MTELDMVNRASLCFWRAEIEKTICLFDILGTGPCDLDDFWSPLAEAAELFKSAIDPQRLCPKIEVGQPALFESDKQQQP